MSFLFIISNSQGHFYSKQKNWTDGKQANSIYRAKHYDEALNTLLELNAKDVDMRAQVLETQVDERGEPIVTISETPLPVSEALDPQLSDDSPEANKDHKHLEQAIPDQATA